MPASIGVNLRVTGHCRQGGRKYMEDFFSVAYQQTEDESDLEYAFFGIYDGHGGAEAAAFAKEHLMETIIKHRNFWSDNDEDVLRAIKDGYIATHYAMWREQEKWPRTTSGLPSTAGTTASVAFIRRGKIYIGHVGDSGIILGYQEPGSQEWKAKQLTRDHKPENLDEMSRIEQCGGKVVSKSGVPRVVWNRPRIGHQGPVRRSTPIDEIPFLAVARSLGDLWSYNSQIDQFIVSPDPDCSVIAIDSSIHRCLIFGTDGLYNMLSAQMAVHIVQQAEKHNENAAMSDTINKTWLNPSKLLVEKALERWHSTRMRADNTSVITLMLDPPGPPRAQVLKNRKKIAYPDSGCKIMTRYKDDPQENNCSSSKMNPLTIDKPPEQLFHELPISSENIVQPEVSSGVKNDYESSATRIDEHNSVEEPQMSTTAVGYAVESTAAVTSSDICTNFSPLKERNFVPKARESTSFDPREPCSSMEIEEKENLNHSKIDDNTIQINEISSSSNDVDILEVENKDNTQHNLRSGSKKSFSKDKENKETFPTERFTRGKRKLSEIDSGTPLRKSSRLDSQVLLKSPNTSVKTSPGKRKSLQLPTPEASLTQKIIKSKKLNLKKKNDLKKPLNPKKIKMVINTVKRVQSIKKSISKNINVVNKKGVKIPFKRGTKSAASVRNNVNQRNSIRQTKNKNNFTTEKKSIEDTAIASTSKKIVKAINKTSTPIKSLNNLNTNSSSIVSHSTRNSTQRKLPTTSPEAFTSSKKNATPKRSRPKITVKTNILKKVLKNQTNKLRKKVTQKK